MQRYCYHCWRKFEWETEEDESENTPNRAVEDEFTSEVEYDSDTSISSVNSERDLNAEVDQIMQSVFGENNIYSDNFEKVGQF